MRCKGADVTVLGLTFKENCADLRNSRVIDVIRELQSYGAKVHVHDPVADAAEARHEYGDRARVLGRASTSRTRSSQRWRTASFARALSTDYLAKLAPGGVYADVKCQADAKALQERGVVVWRL